MITDQTTQVYVRVDLPSRRVIGVSDQLLQPRPDKPVFVVAANKSRLDHYVVVEDQAAEFGCTVRVATDAEIVEFDAKLAATVTATLAKAKYQKAFAIKNLYDECYIRRFLARGFMTTDETEAASTYSGTDANILNVIKPLGIKINNGYNEWRHGVCQLAINTMLNGEGLGAEIDNDTRSAIEAELDTFLTARDFDIAIYHR